MITLKILEVKHKKVLILFTTCLIEKMQIEGLSLERAPNKIYIGLGYNPDLPKAGERLDMLDLFYWMGAVTPPKDWVIWDASSYYIVNRIPDKVLRSLGPYAKPELVLEALSVELTNQRRAEIKEACDVRQRYLSQIKTLFGNQFTVLDARQYWFSTSFQIAFEIASENLWKIDLDNPELLDKIYPKTSSLGSKLYLPLEMAEALFLYLQFDINTKFGPKIEQYFDSCIKIMMQQERIPFTTLLCPTGPRKTPYLSDRNVIWTSSSDEWIKSILHSDKEYRTYVERYTAPIRGTSESLEKCVMVLRDNLSGGVS